MGTPILPARENVTKGEFFCLGEIHGFHTRLIISDDFRADAEYFVK